MTRTETTDEMNARHTARKAARYAHAMSEIARMDAAGEAADPMYAIHKMELDWHDPRWMQSQAWRDHMEVAG